MFWLILQCLGGLCLGLMFWLGPKKGCGASALLIACAFGYFIFLVFN
jgi:hypothetical protein